VSYFRLDTFSGIAPAISPRLLADQFGQIAENIDFISGRLSPTTDDVDVFTLQSGVRRSIYFYRDTNWLEWDQDGVKAVPGPIPGDTLARLYWTGQNYPRMGTVSTIVSGGVGYPANSYRLGVPAPLAAPGVSKSGTVNPNQTPDDVSYVYTLVTAFGEEGPPSEATTAIERTDTESVTITLAAGDVPSGNYNFGTGALKRIYRSNTGSNSSAFQFLAQVPIATGSYVDTTPSDGLGEVLPSDGWISPPDDNTALYPDGPMKGLMAVANGVFAGHTGKRLCLSEPFLPHAWPVDYRITLEEDIVAIGSVANGIVALTNGTPYFVTGTDPSAMTAIRVDLPQACVNPNSVVDMGAYLMYAGPDGLCVVSGSEGRVLTEGLISPLQWSQDFSPTTFRAFRHENAYVAFWTTGGVHRGFVFDPRNDGAAISTLTTSAEVRNGYMNPKDGELYLIVANKIRRYRGSTTKRTLTWKSKKVVLPRPTSMSWVCVKAQAYPIEVRVWADEVLIAQYTLSKSGSTFTQAVTVPAGASTGTLREPIMRLPARLAEVWEVQVSGAVDIDEVCLAQSMEEVAES